MSEKISRRRLVQAGAVAAAGAALPAAGAEAKNRRKNKPVQDVVVVGAGLAGLMAARQLAAKGRKVKVLEARGRVGGRTYSPKHGGVTLDVGGQWLGPTQDKVAALADKLGVQLASRQPLVAPVAAGTQVATLKLAVGGQPWGEYPVVALEDVAVAGLFGRIWDDIRLFFQ